MLRDDVKVSGLAVRLYPAESPAGAIELGSHFWSESPGSLLDLSDWRESLGRFQIEEIEKATAWVWTSMPSDRLEVLDAENQTLDHRVFRFWRAILLTEPPTIAASWILTGTIQHGRLDIRGFVKPPMVYGKSARRPSRFDVARLHQAAAIADSLMRPEPVLGGPLERGWSSFIAGMRATHIDESILCFVRALEGILHSATRQQFSRRAARLVKFGDHDSTYGEEFFERLYNVRSGFTHARTLEETFPSCDRAQALLRGRQLQAAAHIVASRWYRTVIMDPNLVRQFSGTSLGDYWGEVVLGKERPPFTVRVEEDEWMNVEDTQR